MAQKTRRKSRVSEKAKTKQDDVIDGKPFHGLPVELLDAITDFVESQRDLYHLAQSHSVFRDLALPFRLRYRQIRCMVDDYGMWDHLLDDPRRARAVRSLELCFKTTSAGFDVPRDPPLIPFKIPADSTLTVASVLPFMAGLVDLRCREWDVPEEADPDGNSEVDPYEAGGKNIWDLFRSKCPNIEHLEVSGQLQCSGCSDSLPLLEPGVVGPSKVYNFTGLKSLFLDFRCLDFSTHHNYDSNPLSKMLSTLIEIEFLEIHWEFDEPLPLPMLASLRYPRLQLLALTGIHWAETPEAAAAFIVHHPQILKLIFGAQATAPIPDRIPGALLNATLIECEDSLAEAILLPPLPENASRCIKTLAVRHDIPGNESFSMPCLVPVAHALSDFSVAVDAGRASWLPWMKALAELCPNISRLRILADEGSFYLETPKKRSRWWTDAWIQVLSQFPNLKVFTPPDDMTTAIFGSPDDHHWSVFFSAVNRTVTRRQEHSLGTFVATCPKLQYVCGQPLIVFSDRKEECKPSVAHYESPVIGNIGKKTWSVFRGLCEEQDVKLVLVDEGK